LFYSIKADGRNRVGRGQKTDRVCQVRRHLLKTCAGEEGSKALVSKRLCCSTVTAPKGNQPQPVTPEFGGSITEAHFSAQFSLSAEVTARKKFLLMGHEDTQEDTVSLAGYLALTLPAILYQPAGIRSSAKGTLCTHSKGSGTRSTRSHHSCGSLIKDQRQPVTFLPHKAEIFLINFEKLNLERPFEILVSFYRGGKQGQDGFLSSH
jgi:hypothetical protein